MATRSRKRILRLLEMSMTATFLSKSMVTGFRALIGALSVVAFATIHPQGTQAQSAGAQSSPPQGAQKGTTSPAPAAKPDGAPSKPSVPAAVSVPPDYVIGPEDVLSIVYWRDKDMSSDVVVRPDGMISLPLLDDIHAEGLTPIQLRDRLTLESRKYLENPNVSVVVHEINSRKVYITGEVGKPGTYGLTGPTTVLQLLALAGGIGTYADSKHIVIVRHENGSQVTYTFNYKDVVRRKSLKQNIQLKPGDTVIVP
jgi:polysaccharide export outer membrane protein